jgi:hypothetical protein
MSAASPIRRHDAQGRDRALERVRATTRWVFAAAVAATGIVIGLAAHNSTAGASVTQSGTSASGGSGTSGGTSSGSAATPPAGTATGGGGFSSPSVAPSQAPSQAPSAPLPQVRTGGS